MRDPKVYRLVLGLIILFSLFLFQGSDDHHGCTQCEDANLGGSLNVINNSGYNITVLILPDYTVGALMAPNGSKVFYLDEGLYNVLAYQIDGFTPVKVLTVRMVEIKLGSNKTVEIK